MYRNGIDPQNIGKVLIFGKLGYSWTRHTRTCFLKERLVRKDHIGIQQEVVVDANDEFLVGSFQESFECGHQLHRRTRVLRIPTNGNAHVFEIVNRVLVLTFSILVSFRQIDHNISLSEKRPQSCGQLFDASWIRCQSNECFHVQKILVTGLVIRFGFGVLPWQSTDNVPHSVQVFNDPRDPLTLNPRHKRRTRVHFLAGHNQEAYDVNCEIPLEQVHFWLPKLCRTFLWKLKDPALYRSVSRTRHGSSCSRHISSFHYLSYLVISFSSDVNTCA